MTENKVKRKLTAILCADVKGYSRMMGEDEVGTFHTLSEYLEIMNTIIAAHRGRVFSSPGDAILTQFASVVDAVQCAVEIQEKIEAKNANIPEDRKMQFRIGVNLGDVIEKEEQIYGDGVNIAARIEALAEQGGVSISRTVYNHVRNKLKFDYEFQGEYQVKNIAEPIKIYKVLTTREDVGQLIGKSKASMSPPKKPSIAVLPFDNMSNDPDQEYFSDGMTDDLITDLSKISGLFVIARNSVFSYKGRNLKIDRISRELGVRFVLEGSVRKAGERIRINAQLIDATTGGHVWAERYDRNLKNIFALQDEVTKEIVTALVVKLTDEDKKRLVRKGTDNLEAYDYTLRGIEYFFRFTPDENSKARQLFRKAIGLDGKYALGYSWLGWTHWMVWAFGWSVDPQSVDKALELAKKALSLDESLPEVHGLLGKIYLWKKQHDLALAELKRAIALAPNYADVIAGLGEVLHFTGNPEDAILLLKKAIRLNPVAPVWYFHNLGMAYYLTSHYNEAISNLKRVLNRNPNFWPTHIYLAASYIGIEEDEKAHDEITKLLRIVPKFTIEYSKMKLPYKDLAVIENLIHSLKKAGLK